MRFTKMHGIGNDYIFVNCFEEVVEDPERLALVMSQPHFGVGADGLVLIESSETADLACASSTPTAPRPRCAAMPRAASANMSTSAA